MNPLNNVYYKSLFENEKSSRFWQEYLNNLESLDLKQYSNKLKVPILVPIGSRILFRGELKHTNEVTVALGANYFTKCSVEQAEILKQHRIKDAKSKLEIFHKERKYLEDQLTFNKRNVFDDPGKDIVEYQTEEEDESWRKRHRENVKHYKQKQAKGPRKVENDVTDEELWQRLEELELQEELEEELLSMKGENTDHNINVIDNRKSYLGDDNNEVMKQIEMQKQNALTIKTEVINTNQTSKFELLQKVLEKQKDLEQKLIELKNKDRSYSRTEEGMLAKLDELQELEEIEDEINRMDDILIDDEEELSSDSETTQPREKLKRIVTFEDEDDSETLEVEFTHSSVEPPIEPYNPDIGITKPSDVYEAYAHLFSSTSSILKQTNYKINNNKSIENNSKILDQSTDDNYNNLINNEARKTIVIQDISEKVLKNSEQIEDKDNSKPMSLFKQRRMQKK